MKININKMMRSASLLMGASVLLTSCFKKFDTDSYAPPLSIGGYTSAKEVAAANLVGYWSFNGSYVDSVSGVAATNTGTTFGEGKKGQAMQGALNSYVLATPGASITGLTSYTITYWVKNPPPSVGIIGMVQLAKTDGFWGNINTFFENGSSNTNGIFKMNVHNGTTDAWTEKSGVQNMFDRWVHMTISYNATTNTFKIYKDGGLLISNTVAGFGALNFNHIGKLVFGTVHFMTTPSQTTGSGSQPWASYMTGLLDEVRIFNKALTDAEVSALASLEGRGK